MNDFHCSGTASDETSALSAGVMFATLEDLVRRTQIGHTSSAAPRRQRVRGNDGQPVPSIVTLQWYIASA